MDKPEFRVERGPETEPEPFAIGMAKLLEREGRTVAAAELRRLHDQRDALLEALRDYRAAILFAQNKQALMSAIKSADDKARAAIAKVEEEKT